MKNTTLILNDYKINNKGVKLSSVSFFLIICFFIELKEYILIKKKYNILINYKKAQRKKIHEDKKLFTAFTYRRLHEGLVWLRFTYFGSFKEKEKKFIFEIQILRLKITITMIQKFDWFKNYIGTRIIINKTAREKKNLPLNTESSDVSLYDGNGIAYYYY